MNKKSFGLISVLTLVLIFSYLSVNIIQNQTFSSKIDTLKYLDLQANIYLKNIKKYIKSHNESEISSYTLSDTRFHLDIKKEDINISSSKYHIYIKSNDKTKITLYSYIIK